MPSRTVQVIESIGIVLGAIFTVVALATFVVVLP